MQRFVWMVLALALLSSIPTQAQAPEAASAFTLEGDLGVTVEGAFYPILSPVDALLSALGEPIQAASAPACVYEGLDWEYTYDAGSLYTCPMDGRDVWYEFYITAQGASTARGISIGDPLQAVYDAYGEDYYDEGGGMITYSVSGIPGDLASPCIIFGIEEGAVVLIDVYYPINI